MEGHRHDGHDEADLWYVSLTYATYGLLVTGGVVVDAPPIAGWMVGRDWSYCLRWLAVKDETRRITKVVGCQSDTPLTTDVDRRRNMPRK